MVHKFPDSLEHASLLKVHVLMKTSSQSRYCEQECVFEGLRSSFICVVEQLGYEMFYKWAFVCEML